MPINISLVKQIIGGPSDFGIGWIIILMASVIAIFATIVTFWKWASTRLKEKSRFLQMAAQLDTGAHVSYFISVLGNPVSISPNEATTQEYIFVNKYFYVQAVTNPDGGVSLFSVTTRRKDFNPVLKSQFGQVLVVLGETTFSMLANSKKRRFSGDHGGITFYSESCYFGYDGSYRMYFFSANPNGLGNLPTVPASFVEMGEEDAADLERFRAETIINTYTISTLSGPNGDEDVPDNIIFGPKTYQVRVF